MKVNKTQVVRDLMKIKPELSAAEIAKRTKYKLGYIYTLMSKIRKDIETQQKLTKKVVPSVPRPSGNVDSINHPPHYKIGGIETIDFIEVKNLDYHLGNVIKYITRADHKGSKLDDLKKAQWYLNRAIANQEKV